MIQSRKKLQTATSKMVMSYRMIGRTFDLVSRGRVTANGAHKVQKGFKIFGMIFLLMVDHLSEYSKRDGIQDGVLDVVKTRFRM